jgi:hypothetical protein
MTENSKSKNQPDKKDPKTKPKSKPKPKPKPKQNSKSKMKSAPKQKLKKKKLIKLVKSKEEETLTNEDKYLEKVKGVINKIKNQSYFVDNEQINSIRYGWNSKTE